MITDQLGTYVTTSHESKGSGNENVLKKLFLYSHTFSKILLLALKCARMLVCVCVRACVCVYVCVYPCVCGMIHHHFHLSVFNFIYSRNFMIFELR